MTDDPLIKSHGERIGYTKLAEGAPVQPTAEDAYWDQVDRIEQGAWKVAHDVAGGNEPEVGDVLRAACMMLHAAFVEQARLNALISPGFTRSGDFSVRDLKPKPKVVE